MPRPSKPLIRRDAVVEASLRIIDTEGLDALSLQHRLKAIGRMDGATAKAADST